jgi:hypothetical protein
MHAQQGKKIATGVKENNQSQNTLISGMDSGNEPGLKFFCTVTIGCIVKLLCNNNKIKLKTQLKSPMFRFTPVLKNHYLSSHLKTCMCWSPKNYTFAD